MEMQATVLLVDDNKDALYSGKKILEHASFKVLTASDGEETLEVVASERPDLVLLDVMMPKLDGLAVTQMLKQHAELRYVPIVLLSAKDSLQDVVDGLEAGADGYITKPFRPEELIARTQAALRTRALYEEIERVTNENTRLVQEISSVYSSSKIIGESAPIQEAMDLVEKVAKTDAPVLITGPSGTGKELVARSIHFQSPRSKQAFIVKNCAAFSEQLLESQLFGHMKGAFTGAVKDQKGLFEAAHNGTLFLDELGEMPLDLQAKLLRALQEGMIMPVGATSEKKVNVRVIAATNRDIRSMVEAGTFREDLYFRLSVISIPMATLSERREDIPLLVTHFLDEAFEKKGGTRKQVSSEVLQTFMQYSWPGNIRELSNEIERMLILGADSDVLDMGLLSPHIRKSSHSEEGEAAHIGNTTNLKEAISSLEKQLISKVLGNHGGNKSAAAKVLGISRSSLISKVQEYQIEES